MREPAGYRKNPADRAGSYATNRIAAKPQPSIQVRERPALAGLARIVRGRAFGRVPGCYVPLLVRGVLATVVCGLLVASAAGCGGDERQDADEPAGTFEVQVVTASFPEDQSISQDAPMRIVVRNAGKQAIPDLAISLSGLSDRNPAPGLADPEQPLWIVEKQPGAAATADGFTWAMGRLPPGGTSEFELSLNPAVPGTHQVKWTVAAGLNGKAMARSSSGARPAGTFTVRVSDTPPPARVDPDTGKVITGG